MGFRLRRGRRWVREWDVRGRTESVVIETVETEAAEI